MNIFTIGFTERTAESFFETLKKNGVKRLIDIRLNNKSQLSGFAKGEDLKYFCKEILNIEYIHEVRFAPTKDLLDSYRKKNVTWEDYTKVYNKLLEDRNWKTIVEKEYKDKLDDSCFLCSENSPNKCHRRLFTDKVKGEGVVSGVTHL